MLCRGRRHLFLSSLLLGEAQIPIRLTFQYRPKFSFAAVAFTV